MTLSYCAKDSSILKELVCLAAKHPEGKLLQFQSLVGAYQYRLLYSVFRRYVPPGVKVLDWGVGNGHFSYFLIHAGYKTFGFSLDEYPIGVELADAQYDFVQGSVKDPTSLPFKDNSFTAVSSVGVLEHVSETGGNDEESMKEIVRVLKPGGFFICYHLPNRYSIIESIARLFPRKHHHQYCYVSENIKSLIQQTRLQLLEVKRYGFLPRNIWSYAPEFMRYSRVPVLFWNALDVLLSYPFTFFCQNYIFVARKPVDL